MGLDVSVKKCDDLAAANNAEAEYEKQSEEVWTAMGGYDNLTDQQKDTGRAQCKAVAHALGLDDYGSSKAKQEISIESSIDPEHLFKVGYFRSSYNDGGIDSVMRNLGLPSLADIMQPGDGYESVPDWDAALLRSNDAIARYEAHLTGPTGKYKVMAIRPMWEHGVVDEQAALALFAKQIGPERTNDWKSYSNADGEFFLDGVKVVAFITKKFTPSHSSNPIDRLLNRPEIFAVYEKESDGKPDWYLTALKIVRETIEYVIAQPDRQKFYMTWSG